MNSLKRSDIGRGNLLWDEFNSKINIFMNVYGEVSQNSIICFNFYIKTGYLI